MAVAAEQIRAFSEEEKKAISKVMDFIEGRYDLTLDTRKVLFVPYITPTLIRNIHATLLEHFPGR